MGNCDPRESAGTTQEPPSQKTKEKERKEQWVTVPPPPLHYLVMSLMVTTQNSSAAASSKPWHMGSYRITQCIQVRHCDQDSRGSSIQMYSEWIALRCQRDHLSHIPCQSQCWRSKILLNEAETGNFKGHIHQLTDPYMSQR